MMNFQKNKLWGGLPTQKNIQLMEHYPWSYANSDHVFIISPIAPEGMKEITERFYPCFKADDWEWINKVSAEIQKEEESKYAEEYLNWQMEFLQKLEKELKQRKDGELSGTGNADAAQNNV